MHKHQPIKAPMANQQQGQKHAPVHQRFDVGDAKLALPPSQHYSELVRKAGLHHGQINELHSGNQAGEAVKEGASFSCAAALNTPDQGLVLVGKLAVYRCSRFRCA